ncbi:hypothetical protein, partial [Streptomyces rimosus]|uniref:hypothetical protein n=1 Tax=Streptomyces rimosus TaxID=1927 RepID=UPI00131BF426
MSITPAMESHPEKESAAPGRGRTDCVRYGPAAHHGSGCCPLQFEAVAIVAISFVGADGPLGMAAGAFVVTVDWYGAVPRT